MITKTFEKINLKDIDEVDASLGNLIKMSQEAVHLHKGFAITGKISLTDKYTLKTLATYDVIFPIYVKGYKLLGKDKFGKEVNVNLLSTSFDLDGLDKLSLNEVNRLAKNVNILNLRTDARLTEYAFRDLIRTPAFYTKWHFLDKNKDHLRVSKVISALRNPELNENQILTSKACLLIHWQVLKTECVLMLALMFTNLVISYAKTMKIAMMTMISHLCYNDILID